MTKEKIETKIIQAKAYWCKVLGKPRPSYDGKSQEWTVDVLFDKDGLKALQEFGIDRFYIKKGKPNKDNTPNELTGKPVVKFVRKSVKSDGTPANPVPIRDENGDPWDPTKLIGNGSVVNLKLMKFKVTLPGQPARWKPYLLEMQVWDHVEYEGKSYEILSNWKLGESLFNGTCNGVSFTLQVERHKTKYSLFHWGTRADFMVMSARAAELLALMPE